MNPCVCTGNYSSMRVPCKKCVTIMPCSRAIIYHLIRSLRRRLNVRDDSKDNIEREKRYCKRMLRVSIVSDDKLRCEKEVGKCVEKKKDEYKGRERGTNKNGEGAVACFPGCSVKINFPSLVKLP